MSQNPILNEIEKDKPLLEYVRYYLSVVGLTVVVAIAARTIGSGIQTAPFIYIEIVQKIGIAAALLLQFIFTYKFTSTGYKMACAYEKVLRDRGAKWPKLRIVVVLCGHFSLSLTTIISGIAALNSG